MSLKNSICENIKVTLAALFLVFVILGGVSLTLGPIAGIIAAVLIIGVLLIPYRED